MKMALGNMDGPIQFRQNPVANLATLFDVDVRHPMCASQLQKTWPRLPYDDRKHPRDTRWRRSTFNSNPPVGLGLT
jgi:hypothetical protein